MITTLISFGMIILGFILLHMGKKMQSDGLLFMSIALVVCFTMSSIVCLMGIVGTYVDKDIDYQNMIEKREMLEYRIEHIEDDLTGNELLYNDIIEFNRELRRTKKWANSLLTNWFYNQDIATLDYIELDK